ncbi:MAG: xanthine dehydrogenase accessory protein XdhC [Pseudomonadota bacterium]
MSFNRQHLAAAIARSGTVVRVVITAHRGSVPRESGTSMLVDASGISGTIGGGALEHRAIAEARTMLATAGRPRHHLSFPLGPGLGQCCGGAVELLFEKFDPATPLPDGPGVAHALTDDPADVPPAVASALASGIDAPTKIEGWFLEPARDPHRPLWIWGAGHVGRALVDATAPLPFAVTWVDDARTRFPEDVADTVDLLVAAEPPQAAPHAPDDAHHVILTYSHAIDLALCHALLARPAASVGLIGSATKKARFRSRLAALGHTEEAIARLVCPIGHPGLGKEPAAIALGVAFDLLQRERALERTG